MRKNSWSVMVVIAAFVFAAQPVSIGQKAGFAEAAQTTTKKTTTKKTTKKKPVQKKSYCGYPEPPIPAGMSDFCAMQYDFYCRRGVGCNKYGR